MRPPRPATGEIIMQRQRWIRRPRTSALTLARGSDPVHARAHAAAWAAAILGDEETVFLDTETTGFPPRGEIIDVAAVTGAGEILIDTLVRPETPIPAAATAVHGLGDQEVATAPTWIELHALVCERLAGRTVVVYNVEFDRKMIEICCDRYRLPPPVVRWECAMRAYADYRGQLHPATGRFRWHTLEQAARECGVPPGGHRALADAEACRQVVRRMAAG